jgi:hypothetical protein
MMGVCILIRRGHTHGAFLEAKLATRGEGGGHKRFFNFVLGFRLGNYLERREEMREGLASNVAFF